MQSKYSNDIKFYLAWSTFVIMLLLMPYWVFGQYSAIGWYDEADFHIPILSHLAKNPDIRFWPNWAGGTPVSSLIWDVNAPLSLTKVLFSILKPWVSALVYRIVDYAIISYVVIRIFANELVNIKTACISLIILLSTGATQYGWQLGGLGFLYALTLFTVYIFERIDQVSLLDMTLFSFAIIFTGYPVYSIIAVGMVVFIYAIIDLNIVVKVVKRKWIWLILLMLAYIGAYYPYAEFINELRGSARLKNLGGLGVVYSIQPVAEWHSVGWWISPLIGYINDYIIRPNSINSLLICVAFFFGIFFKNTRRLTFVFLLLIVLINCLERIKYLKIFDYIRVIRFEQLFDLIPFAAGAVLVFLISDSAGKLKIQRFSISILTLAFIINGLYARVMDVGRVFIELPIYGGFNMFNISEFQKTELGYARFVSNGYVPKSYVAPLNGLFAFDGVRPNASVERIIFFHDFLYNEIFEPVNPTKQIILNKYSIDDLNYNALSMANVSYIFNQKKLLPTNAVLTKTVGPMVLKDIAPIPLPRSIADYVISPEFSIAKLNNNPWGMVFTPTKIHWVGTNSIDKEYITLLKNLKYREVILPIEYQDGFNLTKVKHIDSNNISIKFTQDGLIVSGEIEQNLLVLNFEPFDNMILQCNGSRIAHVRANLIFTAFYVPKNCKNVSVIYK